MRDDTPEAALARYETLCRIERERLASPLTTRNDCHHAAWRWLRARLYDLQPYCSDRVTAYRVLVTMLSCGWRARHQHLAVRPEEGARCLAK